MSKNLSLAANNKSVSNVNREELISVLQSSLYPGAKRETVELIISYCEAGGLDPMQKPVHPVPMSVKDPQSGQYVWRDVIMPGIGLYRIQADRSKTYAGLTEPEFGPEKTQEFTDKNGNKKTVTFPEWCKITAKKLVGNTLVEFTAKEYWLENYATDSGKSSAPNAMWQKRQYGQLAKCTEAQVLRKGWPEIGAQPTAEEMEGKTYDMGNAERAETTKTQEPAALPYYPEEQFSVYLPRWEEAILKGSKSPEDIIATVESRYALTDEQKQQIRDIGKQPTQEPDEWDREYDAANQQAHEE